jgi:hypothetical protein
MRPMLILLVLLSAAMLVKATTITVQVVNSWGQNANLFCDNIQTTNEFGLTMQNNQLFDLSYGKNAFTRYYSTCVKLQILRTIGSAYSSPTGTLDPMIFC